MLSRLPVLLLPLLFSAHAPLARAEAPIPCSLPTDAERAAAGPREGAGALANAAGAAYARAEKLAKRKRGPKVQAQYQIAIGGFRAAYLLEPDPVLLYNLAVACKKVEKELEALAIFEEELLDQKKLDEAHVQKIETFAAPIRARLAERDVQEATVLLGRKEHEQAAAAWERAYRHGRQPSHLYQQGLALEAAGKRAEAILAYGRFVKTSPQGSELTQDADKKIAELRATLAQEKAQVAVAGKRYDEALAAWQEAYEVSKRPSYLQQIGDAYRLQGNLQQAVTSYDRFLKEGPPGEERKNAQADRDRLVARLEEERREGDRKEEQRKEEQRRKEMAAQTAVAQRVVSPAQVSPTEPAAVHRPDRSVLLRRALGGVALGLGVAGIALGAAGAALREKAAGEYNDDSLCLDPSGRTRIEICGDQRQKVDTMQGLAIGGLVAGGALLITGAVLIGTTLRKEGRPAQTWRLLPGPGQLGLAVHLDF